MWHRFGKVREICLLIMATFINSQNGCNLHLNLFICFNLFNTHLNKHVLSSTADQSALYSPPPDPSKFEPTSVLGFSARLIAEQLTKIETVSSSSVSTLIRV